MPLQNSENGYKSSRDSRQTALGEELIGKDSNAQESGEPREALHASQSPRGASREATAGSGLGYQGVDHNAGHHQEACRQLSFRELLGKTGVGGGGGSLLRGTTRKPADSYPLGCWT